jgi:hypothetical protein
MQVLRSSRFFGDATLHACLNGKAIVRGGGDPKDSVRRIQQALNDFPMTPVLAVDGIFKQHTEENVTAFKQQNSLPPPDNVVDSAMMQMLDGRFVMELFLQKALRLNSDPKIPDPFKPGKLKKNGSGRVDHVPGYATCEFENGTCVELGGSSIWFLTPAVYAAWQESGEVHGTFGVPVDDPWQIDTTHAVQEFEKVTYLFNLTGKDPFPVPRTFWLASRSGTGPIGLPKGPLTEIANGFRIVEHKHGVVMSQKGLLPQPLPTVVYDEWKKRNSEQLLPGAPSGMVSVAEVGGHRFYPFQNGTIELDKDGNLIS